MKFLESTQIAPGISYSAGYTHNCSIMIVHGNPKEIPTIEKYHYHSEDSEYYYVLKGTLHVDVAGQEIKIEQKQCLEVEPKEIHKITKISDDVEYIIVRTNILPGEKIIVEETPIQK